MKEDSLKKKPLKRKINQAWKDFWYLLWKDDSLKGWIFALIIIFIFIKLIFFPLLSFSTGTSLPLAIVESCSMYHRGNLLSNFDEWWELHNKNYFSYGITQEQFSDFIFTRGVNKGDVLFIVGVSPKDVRIGDVIIYNTVSNPRPIIHRVISIKGVKDNLIFSTMGDEVGYVQFFEKEIPQDAIVGKAVFKIVPYAGWLKLIFFELKKSKTERGFCN